MSKLTPKQQRFIEEYLIDLNATQAAIRAGYSAKTAHYIGAENLKKPVIQAGIKEAMDLRSSRTQVTADMIVNQLAKYAFADIRDLMTWDTETGRITLRAPDEIDGTVITELTQTVTEVPFGDNGMADKITTKIKRGDPLKALQLLGQHIGMFDERKILLELKKKELELKQRELEQKSKPPELPNVNVYIDALKGKAAAVWDEHEEE